MAESTEVTDAFTTLADPLRRYVLYTLSQQETSVGFETLATRVAAWSKDCSSDAIDGATIETVRAELYHVHLPKLTDIGVITYQDNPGEIDLTGDTEALQPFLEVARQVELGDDQELSRA